MHLKKIMKYHYLLFMLMPFASCITPKGQTTDTEDVRHYVTSDYAHRQQGYDWTVVTISKKSDSAAYITVRSRADKKKPSCSFEALARVNTTADTLQADIDAGSVTFTISGDTLAVTANPESLLYYYCSGGASLNNTYILLHEPLDTTQLASFHSGQTFKTEGSAISYTVNYNDSVLRITPAGLTVTNSAIEENIMGYSVTGIRTDDLNDDDYPELLVFLTSKGSGSYGNVVALSPNEGKSVSRVTLPPLDQDPLNGKGYQGHDSFSVVEHTLHRTFPVYNPGDINAQPSGGNRTLTYDMVDKTDSRVFKIAK